MKIYKVVPFAGNVVLKKNELAQNAIIRYFDVINQECVNDWEFFCMCPITVSKKISAFKSRNDVYNAFIFAKEDN